MVIQEVARSRAARSRLGPGLVTILIAISFAVGLGALLPAISPLLSALVLGIVFANIGVMPPALWSRMLPGFEFAARRFLRAGIVLLGLQIVLGDIAGLGIGVLALVVAIVGTGIVVTLILGARLGVPTNQRVLIACGFSICGAAAIAGTSEVIEADEEDVAAGIALVAIFGTAMIVIIPLLARLLGLSDTQTGMWAGGSIHEVAQVVAVGGQISGAALTVAVLIKLARVLMLAPVAAGLGIWHRRQAIAATHPPVFPLFVAGFVAMALVRTTGRVPVEVVSVASGVQLWLLAAAMFAIGCGCKFANMRRLGWRPVALGALSTLTVAIVSYSGIVLLY
ncbi:MAG: putative sulfate exporter family transporter [Aeromicrobium sp.]